MSVLQAVLHKQLVCKAIQRDALAWLFVMGCRKANMLLHDAHP